MRHIPFHKPWAPLVGDKHIKYEDYNIFSFMAIYIPSSYDDFHSEFLPELNLKAY